jgi:hypothetical protein
MRNPKFIRAVAFTMIGLMVLSSVAWLFTMSIF